MKKVDAIRYYGTQRKLADALGISQAAVSKWPDRVPKLRQYELERLTGGKLKVDNYLK